MKKKIIIIAGIIILGLVSYFFIKNKSLNPAQDSFDDQASPVFVDAKDVPPDAIVIKSTDDGFVPAEVTIRKGQKVFFVNQSSTYTWPASDPHPIHTDYPGFDPQEPMRSGQAWSFTFEKTGNWKFHDHLKPSSRGVINVNEQ